MAAWSRGAWEHLQLIYIRFPDGVVFSCLSFWVYHAENQQGQQTCNASYECLLHRAGIIHCSYAHLFEGLFEEQGLQGSLQYFSHILSQDWAAEADSILQGA